MNRTEQFRAAGVETDKKEDAPAPVPVMHTIPGECYININGQDYRLAFTMLQNEMMQKMLSEQETTSARGACLPYTAIQMAARQDKAELNISFEDVLLWFDDAFSNDTDEYRELDKAYKDSTFYKKWIAPGIEEEKKTLTLTQPEALQPAS